MKPIGTFEVKAKNVRRLSLDSPEVKELFKKEFPEPDSFRNFINKILKEELNNRESTAQILGTTYRTINHWEKVGLIDSVRTEQKGWRKYSYIELLWLFIILELRNFGISIENILKLKSFLQRGKTDDNNPFPMLCEIAFVRMQLEEFTDFWIIIDGDSFTYDFAYNKDMLMSRISDTTSSVIVNLHKYEKAELATIHTKISKLLQDQKLSELNQLNELLRTGKYSEVVIKFKDGNIERFHIEEFFDPNKINLNDLRKEYEYCDVSVVTKKGKTVYVKRNAIIKP